MTLAALSHALPSTLAAFLASLVEFVEALTVILAVGSLRGWRDALLGTAAAGCTLAAAVAIFGAALVHVPLAALQLAIGTLLLLFGLRWLRKAILRAAGVIPLHDEVAAFAETTRALGGQPASQGWDRVAFGTAFQITMLEGTEVAIIVIATGAGGAGLLLPACLGAAAALLLVGTLGLLLHRPLARLPENLVKFAVGVLLCAFGVFWAGEGLHLAWPGDDWSLLWLVAGFAGTALLAVTLCRRASPSPSVRPVRA